MRGKAPVSPNSGSDHGVRGGQDAGEIIGRKGMRVPDALRCAVQIAEALDKAQIRSPNTHPMGRESFSPQCAQARLSYGHVTSAAVTLRN